MSASHSLKVDQDAIPSGKSLEKLPDELFEALSKVGALRPHRVDAVLANFAKEGLEKAVAIESGIVDALEKAWSIDRQSVAWEHHSSFIKEFSRWIRKRGATVAAGGMPIGTAAACYDPRTENVEMVFNPRFMSALGKLDGKNGGPSEEQAGQTGYVKFDAVKNSQGIGVFIHECYHLIFRHVTSRRQEPHQAWNIACFLPNETYLPGGRHLEAVANMETMHDGEAVRIRYQSGEVAATPEHPILVRSRITRQNGARKQPIELSDATWKKAGEIEKGDYVLLPKYEQGDLNDDRVIDLTPYVKDGTDSKGRSTFSNNAVTSLTIDEDVAWLIGLYVAEGNSSPNVVFSLGMHEHDIIVRVQRVATKMGYKSSLHDTGRNGTQVVLGAVVLGRWLKEQCGDGAGNKHVPEFILKHRNEVIRRAFLSGLVDGDGCRYERRGIPWVTLGTTSKSLAHDVALMLAQDGIGCSYSTQKLKPRFIGESWTDKETIIHNTIWCANGRNESVRVMNGHSVKTQHGRWKTDHQGVWAPVTKVTRERYVGPVYNLSDTPKGTYVANGIMVHNCDLAINSLIASDNNRDVVELPWVGLLPGRLAGSRMPKDMPGEVKKAQESFNKLIAELPTLQSSEWYMLKLREWAKDNGHEWGKKGLKIKGQPGGGEDGEYVIWPEGDEHGTWDDVPEEIRGIIEGKIKSALSNATRKADSSPNGWGNIPREMQADIRAYVNGTVDWRTVLRQFVGNTYTGDRSRSIKRIDRRFPYIHPGLKRGHTPSILVMVDQSGSVDDEQLERIFGTLRDLSKRTTFEVVAFDYTVDESSLLKWNRGRVPPFKRTRSGGTSFDAAVAWVNAPERRGRYDSVIIATDGEAPKPQSARMKLAWVVTPGHKLMFDADRSEMVIQMSESDSKSTSGVLR